MIRPWRDIKTFYQGLVAGGSPLQGMVRLVEQIEASRYVSGVHGETSMHDLCLTQATSSTFPDGPHLRISPRFDGTIEFRYIDTHVREKQWHRIVKEDDAFSMSADAPMQAALRPRAFCVRIVRPRAA
jgi:hypothetical protein